MTETERGRELTDDAFTQAPRYGSLRRWFREGTDRLAGADPGLTQLRTSAQAILGIIVAAGLIYGFVQLTGALQLPDDAGAAPSVAATNHALLIVSMLVGGILAMLAGFAVSDPAPKQQLISTLLLPFPMIAAITLGLLLGQYRIVSLVFLVLLMTGAVYVRRWGPRGVAAGLVAFQGGFLGFFLHREIPLRDVGWLAADIGIGAAASLFVRFVVLRTDQERKLDRMRRSWQSRAARLLELGADALEGSAPRHRDQSGAAAAHGSASAERIGRQVVRFNESTLIVEGQLVLTSPTSARLEAHELFSAELSLTNCARFSVALSRLLSTADVKVREAARTALHTAQVGDWPGVHRAADDLGRVTGSTERITLLVQRLATSLDQYATSRTALYQAIEDRRSARIVATFEPAVQLANGFLPGSVPVSTAASTTPGRGRFERTALQPYERASIQIAVASTIAVTVGNLLDSYRLYWAVLAAFLAFMATTNTGEQVRKALFRVGGTAIGIVVGDLLVRVTGGNVWAALPVVIVVLFLGIYLIRVNYTFMVIGVTMMLSLLYYQLGEFSWHLLLVRLEETAVGVGAVVVTVLVVLPLRPQRVLTTGALLWFRALSALVDLCLERLLGGTPAPVRPAIRALDASWAALEATARPLRHATFGRNSSQLAEIRAVSSAARLYARSLGDAVDGLDDVHLTGLCDAAADMRASMTAIDVRIETGQQGIYMRSASAMEHINRGPGADDEVVSLALRDLRLLDGALARLAGALDMQVRDHDTGDIDESALTPSPGGPEPLRPVSTSWPRKG